MTAAVRGPIPFVVPGYENDPERPLNPWSPPPRARSTAHDGYYCQVGGLREAYGQLAGDGGWLDGLCGHAGCLILVNGPPRSGKTSLVYRCAQWATLGEQPEHEVNVIDVIGVAGRNQSISERTAQVAKRLQLKLQQITIPPGLRAYVDKNEDFDKILPALGEIHLATKQRVWFVLLLPPLDPDPDVAMTELCCYGRAITAGVVCIAESSLATPLRPAGPHETISLDLRYLEACEADTLVAQWPNSNAFRPIIAAGALAEVQTSAGANGLPLTAGRLLSALRQVHFQRLSGNPTPAALNSIRSSEIVDVLLGCFAPGGQGTVHS